MKRKIVNGLLLMALSVSSVSTFVACKDYDEDMNLALRGQITKESSLREALEKQVADLKAFVEGLEECKCPEGVLTKDDLDGYLDEAAVRAAINAAIDAAKDEINKKLENYVTKDDLAAEINNINVTITKVEALAQEALDLAKQAGVDLSKLEERVKALEDLAAGWTDMITNVYTQLAEINAKITVNEGAINELRELIENLGGGSNYDDSKLKEQLKELEGKYETLNELYVTLNSTVKGALGRLDKVETTVGQMESRLATVEKDVATLKTDVAKLKEDVARLDAEILKLKKDLQNMITGITVQAAESPVLGYANTPFGLNATVLAVYYGKPTTDWEFPAVSEASYVNGKSDFDKWTERNIQIVGKLNQVAGYVKGSAGEIIVTGDGETGNAGTLYLTVNPANVNFAGQTLKLVNSQDEAAPATLDKLKSSDRTLSFGYTRAANGFYEAAATISAADVEKATMNLDYNAIQEDVKALVNDRSVSSVLELGTTLVRNLSDVLPAYGVSASWTDQSTNTTHSLYSQYNVAATAVKPLSLAFLNDWKGISSMPGLDRLENLAGEIIDKIKIDLNLNLPKFDDVNIEFKEISADNVDFSQLTVKVTVLVGDGESILAKVGNTIYKLEYSNGDGKPSAAYVWNDEKKDYTTEVPVTNAMPSKTDGFVTCNLYIGDEMKGVVADLVKEFNGAIPKEEFAKLMEDMKQLSSLDSEISGSIADAKNDIKSTINSYISRINEKLTKWINRAPNMVNLTVVANVGNKIGILSQSKANPTKAEGTVTLFPTTYNLELLAPTYKKYVAVTDVFNADGTEADIELAKAANNGANLNKVIDGNTTCTLAGKTGCIYEVTYTAVDYFGKVAIRKYYVKF